ncbi:MAG: hyalin, partial [Planctomycetota bacterium]
MHSGSNHFFTATGDAFGLSTLWKTDGTTAGTVELYSPSHGGIAPSELTDVNGTLFFRGSGAQGDELFKSDGTVAGTVMVKDIVAGYGSAYPQRLTNVAGKLFFTVVTENGSTALWKSDGTEAGTVLVKDVPIARTPVSANNLLFFESGGDLWKSDGTSDGTVVI